MSRRIVDDLVVSGSVTATGGDSTNWNTAYGWGDHSGLYASASHTHSYDNYQSWNLKTNGTQRTTVGSGGTLDIVAGTNVTVSYGAGGVVTINSTAGGADGNDFLDSLNFNTSNGELIATVGGQADVVVDLDGRYALTSHSHSASDIATGTFADARIAASNVTQHLAAGTGLDLTGGTFSVEIDLRNDVQYVGSNTSTYFNFTNASYIRAFVGGTEEFRLTGTDAHFAGDVVAYSSTLSDARLKDDVETIQSASEKVSRLRGVEYTWNKGSRKGQREIGLIAQEVEQVIPEIVREKEMPLLNGGLDDSAASYKTVDYEKLVALLIESNKELQARVEELERKIK